MWILELDNRINKIDNINVSAHGYTCMYNTCIAIVNKGIRVSKKKKGVSYKMAMDVTVPLDNQEFRGHTDGREQQDG